MGLTLEYLNDNRGVLATASGELTGAALVEAVRQVNSLASYAKPICYTFFDCGGLTAISITTGDLALAANCSIEGALIQDTERIVVIFAGDEHTYRLALIYKLFIEQTGWEVWTCRDRAEAVAKLSSRAATKHGITVEIE